MIFQSLMLKIYRGKLIIQNIVMAIGVGALLAVQFLRIRPSYDGRYADFYQGFLAGVAAGLCLMLVIGLVRNLMALWKEERLKALYIKENDERRRQCTPTDAVWGPNFPAGQHPGDGSGWLFQRYSLLHDGGLRVGPARLLRTGEAVLLEKAVIFSCFCSGFSIAFQLLSNVKEAPKQGCFRASLQFFCIVRLPAYSYA